MKKVKREYLKEDLSPNWTIFKEVFNFSHWKASNYGR